MEHVGIDVSLERSSVCVVDVGGKIVAEAKIESHPDAIINFLRKLGLSIERIGLEAGPLSQWLHVGLTKGSFETVLLEPRHVKAALSAMTVKTDRRDARGIAQLLRMGWFRPVHCKSPGSQEVRALLVARKQLLGKLLDVEFSIRGILRGFGLKMGMVTRKAVGALLGLTPRKYQSGETDVTGHVSCVGDTMARTALYEAANAILSRVTRFSALKRWGMDVAKRRGMKRAKVALARKLGVILHRMWIEGTIFRWTKEASQAPQIARA